VLLGAVSSWLAWRWWTDPSARTWPRTLLYGLVTLAAVYTHNFAIFVIAAQNLSALLLGWLLGPRHERWHRGARWLAGQVVWIVGYAPWVPTLFYQTTQHRMTWIPPIGWASVRNTWLYLLHGATWQGHWYDFVGAILGLCLVTLALWAAVRYRGAEDRKADLRWLVLWFWFQAFVIVLVSRYLLIYQDKQMLILLPSLVVLLAVGMCRLPSRAVQALALVAVLALTASPLRWNYTDAQKQDWRELADFVDAHSEPGDLVYLNPYAGKLTFDYYSQADLPQAGYPPEYTLLRGGWVGETATPDVVAEQLDGLTELHPRVWLVDFVPEFWDPDGLIRGRLELLYGNVQVRDYYGVELRLYSPGKP
jgi:hypothetical protein